MFDYNDNILHIFLYVLSSVLYKALLNLTEPPREILKLFFVSTVTGEQRMTLI